ncbi:MAG: PrsW family intramembrane metalloprotease [Oribacterium sp.]|nr:PrsW family intramembrane metalloprotease [Oribacterium sp.]
MTAATSGNEAAAKDIINKLNSGIDNSFGIMFIRTFLVVGLVEEIFKFLVMRSSVKRIKNRMCWLDVVFLGALAGLGFELYEDIMYSGNGLGVVLLRLLTPFHFVFGVLMGYLYGKAMRGRNIKKSICMVYILSPFHFSFQT